MGMEDAIKAKVKRGPKGRLLPGHGLISPGRPKGQSLKEYWRAKFAAMTDEEKEEFSAKLAPDILFKMAEGNPHTTSDVTSGDQPFAPVLVRFLGDDNING